MTNAINDTLRVSAPVESGYPLAGRPPAAPSRPATDLTPDLLRIIRRAVRSGGNSPLDRAIRSAVAQAEPPAYTASTAEERRVHQVAGRLSAILAARLALTPGAAERHRETVRH